MMNKLKILLDTIRGEIIKLACKLGMRKIPSDGLNVGEIRKEKVIVSLTSYGRRVSDTVYYTLISLLRQTYKPDAIILWLDYENWNDEKIPRRVFNLIKYGITIKYCKDIKSYKKLIPSITYFPNDLIITCDDDLFYKRNMIELLVSEYVKDPKRIYSHRAHRLTFDEYGNLNSYNDWENEISGVNGLDVFPTSGGGCLYKKDLLYEDLCKESIFMKLSPTADDVWFYFMAILQKTENVVLQNRNSIYIPLDNLFQYFHRNSCLYDMNKNRNDCQIQAVINFYNFNIKNIK